MSYDIEKKNQNEENFIGFHLHLISGLWMQKRAFYGHLTVVKQKYFSQKTGIGKSRGIGATNQHEIVT